MKRYFLLIFSIAILSACFGGGEAVPQNRYYHLADISGMPVRLQEPFGVIAVSPLQSDVLHHDRMILYSLSSAPLMLNTYYYHQWTNSPGQLIQENLIDYLRDVGFARSVVRYGERERIDGQINGYIQRFERIIGNGAPRVAVRLELSFIPRSSSRRHDLTRVYNVEREASDNSMEATVLAFSAALQTIYGRFVADIMQQHKADAAR